jgi:hypothetical protein
MFGVSLKRGAMRLVFLTKRYVLKVPRASALSDGLRANRTERQTWKTTRHENLCPIIWGDACGFFVVMIRARCLTDKEFGEFLMQDALIESNPFASDHGGGDFKQSNFGVLKGRIVKIDYGGTRFARRP